MTVNQSIYTMNLFRTVLSRFFLPFALLLLATPVFAADDVATLKAALTKHMPNTLISKVTESMISGLYEVTVGTQVVYMDKNARYMVNGDMIDLATRKNLTDAAKSGIRLSAISKITEDDMLVYTPKKVDHTVTVISDVDCYYCRRLHSEMDQYLENNIKVRYIFLPLKGKASYDKTVSVWCAKDRNKALDLVKRGGNIEPLTCDNPIEKHVAVGRDLGVRGTPGIILESGELLPGYVEISELVKKLNSTKPVVVN